MIAFDVRFGKALGACVLIYGVHRFGWQQISEIELLTLHLVAAEDHAEAVSASWHYGLVIVSSREADRPFEVRIMSVWDKGAKTRDGGPRGEWRRVQDSPFAVGRPF